MIGGIGSAAGITSLSQRVLGGHHTDQEHVKGAKSPGEGNSDEDSSEKELLPPEPGPALLYEEGNPAPQFLNVGVWDADPLYVMGSDAYADGEYIYQGFAYDDYGAKTGYPRSHPHTGAEVSSAEGDLHYPTDQSTYGYNAADLLEFRTTVDGGELKYRITLNTMIEPDVAGIAIGINTDGDVKSGTADWGYGIGELGDLGLDHVLVTWGTGAELKSVTSNGMQTRDVETSVDVDRNQIELTVPLDPGKETWRHYLVTGLFDTEESVFKQIQEVPDDENPGGAAGEDPPPVFDVGFRMHDQEPVGQISNDPGTTDELQRDLENGHVLVWGEWRDVSQAKALSEGDISRFHADIDFGQIRGNETEFNVPDTGLINRVYGSRFDFGEGVRDDDTTMLAGRVQPFALYIPTSYTPEEPTPLFLLLHGGSANHNQLPVASPNFLRQFGEQRDALVLAPMARSRGAFDYDNEGELDVFEALSHVDSHYNVDFDRLMVGGASTGGDGSIRIAGRYPDLFNGTFCKVAGSLSDQLLDNFRHVPLLLWNGVVDHRTPWAAYAHEGLLDRNYRHELCEFPGYGHVRLTIEDEWGTAVEYLDGHDTSPAYPWHVTYHANPETSNPQWGLTHDGAYWLSDVSVVSEAETGKVDAKDLNAGKASPEVRTYQEVRHDPDNHVASRLEWHDPVFSPSPTNHLELDLEDVEGVRVWLDATEIDPSQPIELVTESTHEARVALVSYIAETEVSIPAGSDSQTVRL